MSGSSRHIISTACVFCGSTSGSDDSYGQLADEVGQLLAEAGIGLVFGGSDVGLMGRVAEAHMAAGGEVIGVYPSGTFSRDVSHPGISQLHEVGSMHERKALMYELSDAFIALPGGFGTLEELTETLTWNQIGIHSAPTALMNVNGFWDQFLTFLDGAVTAGFLKPANRALVNLVEDPADLVDTLQNAELKIVDKWQS
jgi:uncharacterized protein (TIGR00730 family)